MHELTIAENMCRIALSHASQQGADRITDLYVTVGDAASVEALEFHWGLVSKGTPAEGARLHFELIPTILQCNDCGQRRSYRPEPEAAHSHDYECGACHSKNVEIVSGGETFKLESIEEIGRASC